MASLLYRCVLMAVLVLTFGGQGLAIAQPAPGQRVRVQVPDRGRHWLTGNVVSTAGDSLTLQGPTATEVLGPWGYPEIDRMQISRGRHTNIGRGALFGGAAGVFLGMIGNSTADNDPENWEIISDEAAVFASMVLLATVGALVGVLVRTEKWDSVANPAGAFSADSHQAGFGAILVAW